MTLTDVDATGLQTFEQETHAWQRDREERLRAPYNWLSLAGLFWLKQGENSLGSDPASDVVLPGPWCPAVTGTLTFDGETVALKVADGVSATWNGDGSLENSVSLKSDSDGPADRVEIGPISFTVIVRGGRFAIRVCNNEATTRTAFKGNRWYPASLAYRVVACFHEYEPGRVLNIINVLGEQSEVPCPGSLHFEIDGVACSLDVQLAGDELFINFKDLTCGDTSYPPGRFLYTPLPVNGETVLDFNQAYTPPCGFTPHATCPLPPLQNHLKVRIPAGEIWSRDSV